VGKHLRFFGGLLARGVGTFLVWTLWLGLTLTLALQVYVASVDELEVPAGVLREFDQRLAVSGMHAQVGRTRFDPSGRVLMEDVSVTLPTFNEPLVTARGVYARLDPWALAFGRFEPLELQLIGVSLRVPAMFSPSGRADEIVRDFDATVRPHGADLDIDGIEFRVGDLTVAVHGRLHVGGLQAGSPAQVPFTTLLVRSYGPLARQFAGAIAQLGVLREPILRAELTPSESHGAIVHATLSAAALRLPAPNRIEATELRLSSRFPLPVGGPEDITVAAEADSAALQLPAGGGTARGLRTLWRGRLDGGGLTPVWQGVELAADDVSAAGADFRAPLVSLTPGPWPRLRAEARARLLEAPLAAAGDLDFSRQSAAVTFAGSLSPALLDVVGARLKRDLRRTIYLSSPVEIAGRADFGPGWKFRNVAGSAAVRAVRIHGVTIDEARSRIEFDGRRLAASDASVRFGRSFAQGSYEMPNAADKGFRFLLNGRLQPMDIAPWFTTKWWSEFFGHFRFPAAAPAANVDWRGRWPTDHETAIFLFADCPSPVYNGAAFDHATARLFLRPNVLTDALEIQAVRAPGRGDGTFRAGLAARTLDFDLASSLDFGLISQALGEKGAGLVAPYAFDRPPALALRAHLDQPEATADPAPPWHIRSLHIVARTDGGFRYHDFPFDRAAFTAQVTDKHIVLEPVEMGFAGGVVHSHVEVTGEDPDQKIAFEADLQGASLGRAIEIVQNYPPPTGPAKPAAPNAFLASRAEVRLDLRATGIGAFGDAFSYRGSGTAQLRGAGLYDVPLLGPLSALLEFTKLHFNSAQANFQILGPQLAFSEFRLTGANSEIAARGTYALDRHALDFNARVYPLGRSKGLVQRFIDVPLSLLADVFEVKLTGSPDKPRWSLVAGPSNVARTLIAPGANPTRSPSLAPPTPLAHPAPAATPDDVALPVPGGF
jgi:hypothetical protein